MYRRTFFLIVLSQMMLVLYAQGGLFGLRFGQPFEEVSASLAQQGFEPKLNMQGRVILYPGEADYVDGIELCLDEETMSLTGWSIAYQAIDDENMGDLVVGALISRHGAQFIQKEDGSFRWDLGDGKIVLAGWDYFKRIFVAEYRSLNQ